MRLYVHTPLPPTTKCTQIPLERQERLRKQWKTSCVQTSTPYLYSHSFPCFVARRPCRLINSQQSQTYSFATPVVAPPLNAPGNQLLPTPSTPTPGVLIRPNPRSKSRIIFSAFLLLKYGPTLVALTPSALASSAIRSECNGNNPCNNSYPASVNPNCGLLRIILAGPPLKNARNPSSLHTVRAACRNPV